MTALHLDATFAEYNTWRELALCFLHISQCEEDRMSVCQNENVGGQEERDFVYFSKTPPKIFTEGKSGSNWKLRCRWWSTRHFSNNTLASEIAAGTFQDPYQGNHSALCHFYHGVSLFLILPWRKKILNHGGIVFAVIDVHLIALCIVVGLEVEGRTSKIWTGFMNFSLLLGFLLIDLLIG